MLVFESTNSISTTLSDITSGPTPAHALEVKFSMFIKLICVQNM